MSFLIFNSERLSIWLQFGALNADASLGRSLCLAFAGERERKKEIIGKAPATACLSFSPQLFENNLWGGQIVFCFVRLLPW